MKMKAKRISLVICLFLFLFVVIGNGLHLNPASAFIAAATGTPLLVYLFKQRSGEGSPKNERAARQEILLASSARLTTPPIGSMSMFVERDRV